MISSPFASKRFHALLNSLFKVLFKFSSMYLFAVRLVMLCGSLLNLLIWYWHVNSLTICLHFHLRRKYVGRPSNVASRSDLVVITVHITNFFFYDFANLLERAAAYASPLLIIGDVNVHLDEVPIHQLLNFNIYWWFVGWDTLGIVITRCETWWCMSVHQRCWITHSSLRTWQIHFGEKTDETMKSAKIWLIKIVTAVLKYPIFLHLIN